MNLSVYPITQFHAQTQIVICKIECAASIKEKLASIGIEEGVRVEILQCSEKNSLVIVKRDNRRIILRCNKNLLILGKQI